MLVRGQPIISMEDSLSITKDISEYYIYLKDNSNLIAKGYEKSFD